MTTDHGVQMLMLVDFGYGLSSVRHIRLMAIFYQCALFVAEYSHKPNMPVYCLRASVRIVKAAKATGRHEHSK